MENFEYWRFQANFNTNKTSMQWTPDDKFISATINKFWSKIIFDQQNNKNFAEKNKIWGEKLLKAKKKIGINFLKNFFYFK